MLAAGDEDFVTARYALYFVPAPETAWAHFGRAWFARESALTAVPRRYGFHATLKAPFRLAEDTSLAGLTAELDRYCATRTAFNLPHLQVRRIGGFLAAVPLRDDARISAIAADVVRRFDRFRAPLDAQECAKRRRVALTQREEANLVRWGYPYVLEDFRFHFSLTGPLDEAGSGVAARIARAASSAIARLSAEVFRFDAITVFEESGPGAELRAVHCAPLRRRGRLIYVVGPSGAGKDSLLAWVGERLPPGAPVCFARRVITRPPQGNGEQHAPASVREFADYAAQGAFAMYWKANGDRYGIERGIVDQLEAGLTVLVNGSRAYLPKARLAFPDLEVVHVTAAPELRKARLAARRRERPAAIRRRLTREPPVPAAAIELVNDRALEVAGAELLRFVLDRA